MFYVYVCKSTHSCIGVRVCRHTIMEPIPEKVIQRVASTGPLSEMAHLSGMAISWRDRRSPGFLFLGRWMLAESSKQVLRDWVFSLHAKV